MLFWLYPAALLVTMTDVGAALAPFASAAPPPSMTAPAAAPTFDPDAPPSWWTDKMRQPCTKSGDRVVC